MNEEQIETVLSLSQLMILLTQIGGNYSKQRLLTLQTGKMYLEDGANFLARMWLAGKLDHDDYHTLMAGFKTAWDIFNKLLSEDFEVKEERNLVRY